MHSIRSTLGFIFLLFSLMVFFETFQSLFYIQKFQPGIQGDFFEVLKQQTMRWVIWLAFSFFIFLYVKKLVLKKQLQLFDFTKLFLLILILIFLDVFFISLFSYMFNQPDLEIYDFIKENVIFYAFHKTPIYILGYICFSAIFYFYLINHQLKIEILEFGQLKKENTQLYEKLMPSHKDKASVLKIKVGNKYKIIAVDNINWLSADDYCVNVHTTNESVYSLRKSLKALEKIMPQNFLRVHRSAIVNMENVSELTSNGSHTITLSDGKQVSVSKSKIKQVNAYIAKKTYT